MATSSNNYFVIDYVNLLVERLRDCKILNGWSRPESHRTVCSNNNPVGASDAYNKGHDLACAKTLFTFISGYSR